MAVGDKIRDLALKYGKVAIGVHLSVSAASIAGLYVAINNNVDVDALFHRLGLHYAVKKSENPDDAGERPMNRTAEMVASSGGALMLAVLLNKALLPVRAPITIALTPPVARFLRARNLVS